MDGTALLNAEVPDGGFQPVKRIKGSPVPADTVEENIRASADFAFPIFTKKPKREGSCIFVAGGPSLLQFLDEIRARKAAGEYILTSNNTHDWLVERGIIPDGCLIFDPKKRVAGYVKQPHKEVTYYLGTTVCREVWQAFFDAAVPIEKVCVAYGLEGESDLKIQHALYPHIEGKNYLIGGTMTPLRALPFAIMLGFKKIEYYGMDSCFGDVPPIIREGEEGYEKAARRAEKIYHDTQTDEKYVIDEPEGGGFFYAYKKDRTEDILIQKCGSRRFLTSPGFAYQCKQLVEWADRMEGKIDVEVHGDSLSAHALKLYREAKAAAAASIGDRRWTKGYAEMQASMHRDRNDYGVRGHRHMEQVARLALGIYAQVNRPIAVLDYGCGNGGLGKALEEALRFVTVVNYDPFQPQYAEDPEPCDVVACFDVLEHVEEQCVENTLRYIAKRCKVGGIFQICLVHAQKELPDGRNAHITVKNAEWWKAQLSKVMQVAEVTTTDTHALFICAARNE